MTSYPGESAQAVTQQLCTTPQNHIAKVSVKYRNSNPIIMNIPYDTKLTIRELANKIADELANTYQKYRKSTGNPISNKSLISYKIGQRNMIISAYINRNI